jgi:2-aminoadipate transaminase
MFVWLQLPAGLDAEALFPAAIARKVAFVPGVAFFVEDHRRDFVRLNFSNQPPASIIEGMKRFGQVVAEGLASQ